MYFLYVDESGDTGRLPHSTPIFVLSGFVFHELAWHSVLDRAISFRRLLRTRYGLKLREEIHSAEFLRKPGELARIPKSLRLRLLRDVLEFVATIPELSIVNVMVTKAGKHQDYDVFDNAWRAMVQRFHNTMGYRNFRPPRNPKDYGIVVVDRTDEQKLQRLTRQLRRYNPVPGQAGLPSRMMPIDTVVEDAVHRDSKHSYLLQLVDVVAYFLYQRETGGNKYVRAQGARNYFNRVRPALCTQASSSDPEGVVRL